MDEPSPIDIPEELLERIKPELAPGERLLWASRAGLRFRKEGQGSRAGAMVWFAGLLVVSVTCLTAPFFISTTSLHNLEVTLQLLGLFSGVIGFLVLTGTCASYVSSGTERGRLAGQLYAVTDRRAIIWVTEPKTEAVSVHTFARGTIKPEHLHRVQYPDGSGDLVFQEKYTHPSGFIDVDDVRRVEELLRRYLIASDPESTP